MGPPPLSLRKYMHTVHGAAHQRGFNGAATLSLRKYRYTYTVNAERYMLPMGPQLYRCGNVDLVPQIIYGVGRFNGAATLSLRKCIYVPGR